VVGELRFCLGMLGGTTATFRYLGETKPREQGLPPGKLKELALLLEEKGLPEKAIEAYKPYLDRTTLDDNSRAAMCCSIGKLTAVRLIDKTLKLANVKFLPERLEPFRK